ncbi:MAG: T9SS type A sorting domain-containing protein [Bacteroidetes bacterium]|nr:T9SS type A sorting domain-containing protein [Bacteroidota bacterium]
MRRTVTLLTVALAVLCAASANAQIVSADNIIMRVRTVCNTGQGGSLIAAFDIKPLTNMWAPNYGRIGGYSVTFTFTSSKLVFQGAATRYNTNYWQSPFRSQAFGTSAWFNQHAHHGNPGAALPVSDQYFSPSLDCQNNPLNDGFFEIMRYEMIVMATANGTVNLGLYDIQPYNTYPYTQNVQMSAVFNADLTLNVNDSVETVIGLLIPVELSSFNVTPRADGSMLLNWQTETETSNLGFEIERGDGEHFERVGYVSGHGTTNETQLYSWIDAAPVSTRSDGIVYYRLRQIDTDGTFAYSEMRPAEIHPLVIGLEQNYPNPVTVATSTNIPFTLSVPAAVHLAIYNAMGQQVAMLSDGMQRQSGRHVIQWDARSTDGSILPTGVYFVRFSAEVGNDRISDTQQISLIR